MLELIDLTSLNDTDNTETIAALCEQAVTPNGQAAAVCVYPQFISEAKKILAGSSVRIATVVNFPQGNDVLENVLAAIRQAISDGADEIDVVFPYQDYLHGEKQKACDFIRACKAACGEKILLKVIIETGALADSLVIAEVSYDVCHAGADFLKTSTGKISVGATPEAARTLLTVIKKIPRTIGFKVSGGVRTVEQARQYIQLAEEIMGPGWVTPAHFRIGASQLFV
ncbi:MAG TPA: deoxyribose-phosphate aldolase [Gammaproteobacteria bacterium]|nr:deoxyribose-phosphate aldolase [Gammaproteobacteria bacterium]